MWRLSPRISKTAQLSYRRIESVGRTANVSTTACNYEVVKSAESTAADNVASTAHTPPPPPPPPPKKSGGLLWKLVGLSLVGAGGVVGYGWYDSSFRKNVEDRVPYSKDLFTYVFQYLPTPPTQVLPVPSSSIGVLPSLPAKVEEKVKDVAESSLSAEEHEKLEEEQKKKREREKLEWTIKQQEALEAQENKELEEKLTRLLEDSSRSVQTASASLVAAAASVREQTQLIRHTMDESGSDADWQTVTDSLKSDAIWTAEITAEKAKMELDRLKSSIDVGRAKQTTHKNKSLLTADERSNQLHYELSSAVAQLSKAVSEAKVVAEYRNLVRRGREQFRKELEAIVPDAKIGQRLQDGQLTEDELNSLIAHAHRRIEQLQRQLLEQQAMERQRLAAALDQQKTEDWMLAAERIAREKDKMAADVHIVKQKWDEESRVQFERDLRAQLSRQAAAHSDHITEVLSVQQQELQAAFDVHLAGQLARERAEFQKQVTGWTARMHGLDKALGDRAEADKMARMAQELWLACQTLQTLLVDGRPDATSWEERLQPLKPDLDAIAAAAADPEVVSTIISTIPETALTRGVWTESALTERFARVSSVARRVAFIDESGGTLFRYLLSYAMSMFVVRGAPRDPAAPVDVGALTPFMLLDRAAYCLDRGDLEQAVRYVNQLRGEARNVASDWLREARLLLECRLAADALTTHAVAAGFKTLVV